MECVQAVPDNSLNVPRGRRVSLILFAGECHLGIATVIGSLITAPKCDVLCSDCCVNMQYPSVYMCEPRNPHKRKNQQPHTIQ